MIYTHAMEKGVMGLRSPLDAAEVTTAIGPQPRGQGEPRSGCNIRCNLTRYGT